MLIQETYVNETKGQQFSQSEPYEPFTDDLGKLYRNLQREYGRCTSKVYHDVKNGPPIAVGWVFSKRMEYEDARPGDKDRTYLRTVWVSLFDECEHGDPAELQRSHGRERCASGLKYRVIG